VVFGTPGGGSNSSVRGFSTRLQIAKTALRAANAQWRVFIGALLCGVELPALHLGDTRVEQ